MKFLRAVWKRMAGMVGRGRRDEELVAELEAHLQFHIEDNVRAGMTPEEARRQALIKLGGMDQTKEAVRDRRTFAWLESVMQDIRFALRMMGKNPGFTIVAVLTLALGVGANSTIFSWINSIVLNPIPGVKHTNEYVMVTTGKNAQTPLSYLDYADLRDRNGTLSSLIATYPNAMSLTANGKPERVWGMLASANYFDALGVRPTLGRGFLPSEDTKPNGAPVVVISYHLWQTHFGGDRSAVGQTIEINRHPFEIVGIAPREFVGTQTGLSYDLWIPLMMIDEFHDESVRPLQDRRETWLLCMGRLKPTSSPIQAQIDLNVLMRQIANQFPDEHRADFTVTTSPMWRAPFGANFYLRTILFLLLAISGVVLLLACANVANLVFVRSIGRRREMAIRLSLGATRSRLVRQMLVESLMLAMCGGVVAMVFTLWTARALASLEPPVAEIPLALTAHVDKTVLIATFVIAILAGLVFGILPAFRSSGLRPAGVLKEEGASASSSIQKARLASALVVAQVAMSLLLLVCAGLFIRSIRQAQVFDPGFNPHHVLLDCYDLSGLGYDIKSSAEFHRHVFDKLRTLPGIESASLADWIPLGFNFKTSTVEVEGYVPQSHESMDLGYADVGPDYLRTMQIPVMSGREFTIADTNASRLVAIVNARFADRYWPHTDAIGKTLRMEGRSFTVVGVAKNSNYDTLGQETEAFFYLPLFQRSTRQIAIYVRVPGDPLASALPVQDAVHSLDADLPLFALSTLDSRVALNTTTQRLAGIFVGCFGIVALALAGIGIYGVLAYATRQRTQEIGIRMALGAQPQKVMGLVLGHGLKLVLVGLAIGLAASFALTRALAGQLFGISATDPLTYAGVAILLVVVALLACYIPARRAMRIDPVSAMRCE